MMPDSITDNLFVVDYTEYHNQHPNEELPSEGVSFLQEPDSRLGAFCILNPSHYPFQAINLERHKYLVTDDAGKSSKQCECICRAERNKGKRWILLLELKYCSEDNIPTNMQNAFDELESCYQFLKIQKHFFDDAPYRVYLCASHPEHPTIRPFGEFIFNQDRLLTLNDEGLKVIYRNAVKILTPEYLSEAEVPRRYQTLFAK